jgi:glycine/D-amino acid oxidase-like deaminating enzyme
MTPQPGAGRAARSVIVVGGGIFGITAAIELAARGWQATVVDAGPVPRPEAATTDISKVIRMDYGADALYTDMAEAALDGWDRWNAADHPPLYHQDGFLLLSEAGMDAGGFEDESHALLTARGHRLDRLEAGDIGRRFPLWSAGRYRDGYFNPRAGWAESAAVLARLAKQAEAAGVRLATGVPCDRLIEHGARVEGVRLADGVELRADVVLAAAGAWTPALLPHLTSVMWTTGQPVVHFRVDNPADWQAPVFPVWGADIARTGWYGFPALPDGRLKIGHHGQGRRVHPDEPRTLMPQEVERFREFVAAALPALGAVPIAATRLCLYCDTFDGNFWIDHDPDRPGLVVAAGDSGHAFKFAPILGGLIADVVEQHPNPWAHRFRWRQRLVDGKEAARAPSAIARLDHRR